MKKATALFFALILFCSISLSVVAEDVQVNGYVESVDVYLPKIDVLVSSESALGAKDVKATLNGEELMFKGLEKYDPSAVSTCYYVLMDISGSISSQAYNEMAARVNELKATLSDKQTLKAYAFSQDVTTVLDGNESAAEAAKKLSCVRVTGNGFTALYDALYLIHENAVASKDTYERQLVIIFSDGENEDNKAKRTRAEVERLYKNLDLPIYAMCLSSASSSAKQTLGEIARVSGGMNRIYYSANVKSEFEEVLNTINECVYLHFEKKNNKAEDIDKNLSISLDGVALPTVTVYESAVRISDDSVAPECKITYSHEQKCLEFHFSEPVIGADVAASYTITNSSGRVVAVDSVQYDSSTNTARLFFSGRFYTDEYTVGLSGITDDSFAANKPNTPLTVDISAESSALKILDNWWIFLIPLFLVFIILLVLLVVKRKRKITNVKELFEVENESNYEVKHHILNPAKGNEVMLEIISGSVRNVIKTRISTSLIFGRSDTCDICIDDVKLSRQHFAVESEANGGCAIFDLNSTNGTFLNGVKLTGKREIRNNDVINAGLTSIKISFM